MVAFTSLQRDHIIESVQMMYTEVATKPEKVFHFPTGRPACEYVGYSASDLDAIPATAVESFSGVGYPFAVGAIKPGNTVLDIGSGSGTDVLISTLRAGTKGKVFGLDMTTAMLNKLQANIKKADVSNIELITGEAEDIPLLDASIDVVTSNGVLNLVLNKKRAFKEIFRVLRPGGRVQIADIVVSQEISIEWRQNPKLWAECIVGAMEREDYLELFRAIGFKNVAALNKLDYFSASVSRETREIAASLGAHSMVMQATKPVL